METTKKRNLLFLLAVLTVTFLCPHKGMAQQRVADKEIIGTWILESQKYDGEEELMCRKDYSSIKVYRANGEYACAELVKSKDGTCIVGPHEYGTYTYKNGKYTEMGRPFVIIMDDATHLHDTYMTRHEKWVKVNLPTKLVDFIVEKCRVGLNNSAEMQTLMKKYIFTK